MTYGEASTRRPVGATADDPAAPAPPGPLVLERYRLVRRLGAGAFGSVWAARDERLQRDVAVKILDSARIAGGRFEREARAAARLAHPAIVTLYEAGVDEQGAYLVCELVRGATLERLIAEGRLSDRRVLQIGIALCDALEHAHAAGVIHRDIKPSNVLVPSRPAAETPPAKLTDFGVAHVVGADALTRAGEVLGTDAYMAPEQARGEAPGPAADLFSLALVLYEGLTGVNPLRERGGARGLVPAERPLPPLRRQRRDLPRELAAALDTALKARLAQRGSVAELREALDDSQARVSDRPGTIAAAWSPPALTAPTRLWRRASHARPGRRRSGDLSAADACPTEARWSNGREQAAQGARRRWPKLPARGLRAIAALASAGAVVWLHGRLGAGAPSPVLALAAAVAVLVAPRLGWLAVVASLVGLGVASGHAGGALLVALAGLLPSLVLPRRGELWPLGAVAVALALVGLGGAWPALAGRVRGVWSRLALGAIGWAWLSCAAALSGLQLYVRDPAGVPSPGALAASPALALHGALGHLATAHALAGAAVWAAGAALAPLVTRLRRRALVAVAAIVWAVALALGALVLSGPVDGPTVAAAGLGALGALGAMAVTVALRGPWVSSRRALAGDAEAGLA